MTSKFTLKRNISNAIKALPWTHQNTHKTEIYTKITNTRFSPSFTSFQFWSKWRISGDNFFHLAKVVAQEKYKPEEALNSDTRGMNMLLY